MRPLAHRLWIRQANGPLPDPLPPVRRRPCPDYLPIQLSCCHYSADEHPRGIYLNRWDWKHRPTFYHEHVHWFDYQYLTDSDREEIRRHFDWPDLPWWHAGDTSRYDPNCERLADAGARMMLHPRQFKWLRRKLRACQKGAP